MTRALYPKSSEVILCFSWGTELSCFGAFCLLQSLRLHYFISLAEARTFCSTDKSRAGLEDMRGSWWYYLRWTTPKKQTCSCMHVFRSTRNSSSEDKNSRRVTQSALRRRIQVSEECYFPWDPCGFKHYCEKEAQQPVYSCNSIHRAYESS